MLHADEFSLIMPISIEKADKEIKIVEPVEVVEVMEEEEYEPLFDEVDEAIEDDTAEFFEEEVVPSNTQVLTVNFHTDSDKILQEYDEKIELFAAYLQKNPGYQVIIYGHTDNSGLKEKNKVLSKNRAISIKKRLEEHKVKAIRLTAIGQGDKEPIADNESAEGRKKNRRIEILIIK